MKNIKFSNLDAKTRNRFARQAAEVTICQLRHYAAACTERCCPGWHKDNCLRKK